MLPILRRDRDLRKLKLDAVCAFVILDQQPFNVVDASSLRHLLETYCNTSPVYIPSRRDVTERVEEMATAAVETLTDTMAPLWPAMTTDNWTSNTGVSGQVHR